MSKSSETVPVPVARAKEGQRRHFGLPMFDALRRLGSSLWRKFRAPTPEELKREEQQRIANSLRMLYLQRMSSLDPSDPDLRLSLAETLEKSGQTVEAFSSYVAAAKLFLDLGGAKKAFGAAEKALATRHTSAGILSLYVEAAAGCNRLEDVEKYLVQRLEAGEERLPLQLMQALVLEKQGRKDAARGLYCELQNSGVDHPLMLEGLRRTSVAAGVHAPAETPRTEEAEGEKLEEAIEGAPEFLDIDDQIHAALDTLFGEFPKDDVLVGETGGILRYDEALKEAPDPEGVKIRYDLGLAYMEMGLTEDAIEQFIGALENEDPAADPQQTALCYSMLANSYFELAKYGEAIFWAKKGLEYSEKTGFMWKALVYDLASALEKQGRLVESLERFQEIEQLDEQYRDVKNRISELRTQLPT